MQKTEIYAFDATSQLGEGAQGKVVMAKNVDSEELVAVKIQRPLGMTFEEDVN